MPASQNKLLVLLPRYEQIAPHLAAERQASAR